MKNKKKLWKIKKFRKIIYELENLAKINYKK